MHDAKEEVWTISPVPNLARFGGGYAPSACWNHVPLHVQDMEHPSTPPPPRGCILCVPSATAVSECRHGGPFQRLVLGPLSCTPSLHPIAVHLPIVP